jgi:basic membrane protein A
LVTDVGGLGDRSYNDLAYAGLLAEQERDNATYQVLSSRTTADYIPNLEELAAKHLSLVVAVGFSMGPAVYTVARAHPRQRFALIDARPVDRSGAPAALRNVADIFFKEQESGYLAGVVAGLMEKDRIGSATHGAIGCLGARSIPPVNHYLAGYIAGARRVNPSIKILRAYSDTFSNRDVGRSIATQQIAQGADTLFQVAALAGTGYLEEAQREGRYGIGSDIDQRYLGGRIVTSAVKRVDVAVSYVARELRAGRFHAGDNILGLAQGATGIAPLSSAVPAGIRRVVQIYARRIARGQIVPPATLPPA